MILHERFLHVQEMRLELGSALAEFQSAGDLTDVEMLGLLIGEAGQYTKYLLRIERHGDASMKADEADPESDAAWLAAGCPESDE